MQEKIKSEGKCLFCGKMFAKAGISRHLATHLQEVVKPEQQGQSFLVKVETAKRWGTTPYFLSLWIDGDAKMEELDKFLRRIWLDCCGHLSAFTDPEKKRKNSGMFDMLKELEHLAKGKTDKKKPEDDSGEVSMSRKAKDVLYKDRTLNYEYDFGSTTALSITVVEQYPVKAHSKIVLLSRNEPLPILCSVCGKAAATQICTTCMYDGEAEFCNKCASKHAKKCEEFADYAAMPVVNSPRMGVCGYDGGTIDKERDGVYQMK
jgi:hypothetical protein